VYVGSGGSSFLGGETLPTYGAVISLAGTNFSPDAFGDLVASDEVAGQVFLGDFSGDLTLDAQLPGNPYGERRVLSGSIGAGASDEVVGYTPKSGWMLLELWNDGIDGPYLYSVGGEASLADMGDVTGDGQSDVVVGGSESITYLHGDADPGFASLFCQSTYFLGVAVGTMAVGDFDGDLRADVVVESGGAIAVLRTP
jgi:hypothetical protein